MALSQDQFLNQQLQAYEPGLAQDRARKLQALKQAQDSNNQSYDTGRATVNNDYMMGTNAVNAETKKMAPTWQISRNSVDADTAQRVQQLRNSMANSGLYRSGSTVSDESMFASQGATLRGNVDTSEKAFGTSQAGKLGDLERSKAVQMGDIQGKQNLSNQQFNAGNVGAQEDYNYGMAGARGQALNNWNQYNEQQQSLARAAQARSVSAARASTAAAKKAATPKAFSNSATNSMATKMSNALAEGASVDELLSELNGFEQDGTASLGNYDVGYLRNFLEGKRPAPTPAPTNKSGTLAFYQKWR